MSVRAVIFDVYGTLLEVGPPPADSKERWDRLWREAFGAEPRLNGLQFSVASSHVIARHHQAAETRGIAWPEVLWPDVVAEVLPELARLSAGEREDFLFRQMQAVHCPRMTDDAAAMLRWLRARRYQLGIASNAQAYTRRELGEALGRHALGGDLFDPALCFWSFEYGFSKPNPHVWQILSARLAARGIASHATWMVGDRLDNDIQPAKACGWRTWHLGAKGDGGWDGLREALGSDSLVSP